MNNMSDHAIDVLEKLEGGMSHDSASVVAVRIDDPITAVETSLSEFVTDSMNEVRENHELKAQLRAVITTRIAEANIKQLMDFYRDIQVTETAATATLINPLAGIQSAKIQAEIETHQYTGTSGGVVEERLFKKGSKDILQGITQLNQLLSKIQEAQSDPLVTAEIIKEK
jgi:uncharacterized protein YqgV (UPF0045/DUF77 family)